MAHTNSRPIDFTAPINENGSIITGVKQALIKTFRALAGKNILQGSAVTFNTSAAQLPLGLSFQVKAGKQYRIKGTLLVSTGGTPGAAAGLSLPGSSAPTMDVVFTYVAAATIASQAVTTFTTTAGVAAVVNKIDIDGYFVPDVSGLLTITGAQSVSTASNTIFLAGSNVAVYKTRG